MAIISTSQLWNFYKLQLEQDNHYEGVNNITVQRAIACAITEAGEMLDSMGAPWWKNEFDRDNILVEAVDIMKFMLIASAMKQRHEVKNVHKNTWGSLPVLFFDKCDTGEKQRKVVLKMINEMASLALSWKSKSMSDFNYAVGRVYAMLVHLLDSYGYDERDFDKAFSVKTYLNIFRRENGYAEGEYAKKVNGVEDNVAANEIYNKHMPYKLFAKTMKEKGYGRKV